MKTITIDTDMHRPSIRVAKAAAILEVNISTIYKLVRAGTLGAHRVGKRGVRVFADSLRQYQDQQKISVNNEGDPVSQTRDSNHGKRSKRNLSNTPAHQDAVGYLQSIGCL
jgi:excisionase family DNA binding protein